LPFVKTEEFKTELRRLVSAGRLEAATEQLLSATQGEEYGAFRSLVVHQAGQLQFYKQMQIEQTQDFATLARTRNQVSLGLLDLIDDLPDSATLQGKARQQARGVSEHRLKRRLFWLLSIAKLLVIGFAAFLWNTGSFSVEQFVGVTGILVPIFAAYLTLMIQDWTQARNELGPGEQLVSRGYARMAYILVLAYPVLLLFLLNLRGPGVISFTQLTGLLALAESGMGAYVGKVIFGLFRER
jgi:hypothetical protein